MWAGVADMYEDSATVGKTNALLNACGKTIQIKKLEMQCAARVTAQPSVPFRLPGATEETVA